MSNRESLNIEGIQANLFPCVHLTPDLSEVARQGRGLIEEQGQCDCDCACALGDQYPLLTLSGPVTAYLELTAACPNRCPGCGNVFIDRQRHAALDPPLNLAQWESILDRLLSWVSLLKLTGGEPTYSRDLFSLLHRLREVGIPFVLLSNGRWPDPHRLLDELERCPDFRGFLISLHGPDLRTHEGFTGTPGSFVEAAAAIRAASSTGFDVTVSVVLVRPNLGLLRATAEAALHIGADHVLYERYIGEPRPGLMLCEDELHQAMREVQALEEEGLPVKFGNCIPQCFERSSSTGCTAGRSFCTVDPWGNVRPCNHARVVAGNLLSQSLEEIWWSEPMTHWREVASPDCLHCQAFPQCHGGCRALSYGRDGDPLMREPLEVPDAQSREQITLYAHAVPQSHYTVRPESFGPVLICGGRVLPISSGALTFLEHIDGRYTLAQIEREHGDQALSLLGGLYSRRFISFHVQDVSSSAGGA